MLLLLIKSANIYHLITDSCLEFFSLESLQRRGIIIIGKKIINFKNNNNPDMNKQLREEPTNRPPSGLLKRILILFKVVFKLHAIG